MGISVCNEPKRNNVKLDKESHDSESDALFYVAYNGNQEENVNVLSTYQIRPIFLPHLPNDSRTESNSSRLSPADI